VVVVTVDEQMVGEMKGRKLFVCVMFLLKYIFAIDIFVLDSAEAFPISKLYLQIAAVAVYFNEFIYDVSFEICCQQIFNAHFLEQEILKI